MNFRCTWRGTGIGSCFIFERRSANGVVKFEVVIMMELRAEG